MSDFMTQISLDLEEYITDDPSLKDLPAGYLSQLWILDKLYQEDVGLASDQIVKDASKLLWTWTWHENSKTLYIGHACIGPRQLSEKFIEEHFITCADALKKGQLKSSELKEIYKEYKKDPMFDVHMELYFMGEGSLTPGGQEAIKKFNKESLNNGAVFQAYVHDLDDIRELYYGEPIVDKKTMGYELATMNKGTILRIDTHNYGLNMPLNAAYVMAPVLEIYNLIKEAKKVHYPIFEDNIREYLGQNGQVNKSIAATLRDPDKRDCFFYFNNGITIIVSELGTLHTTKSRCLAPVKNPQIVNGCQTVSTIYEVMSTWDEEELKEAFANTFVLAKILEIDGESEAHQRLKQDIVLANNSQNKLDESILRSNTEAYKRIQAEFEKRGFLLFVKQSDKYQYLAVKYKGKKGQLLTRNEELRKQFDLLDHITLTKLSKNIASLLQAFVAFLYTAQMAQKSKKRVMVTGSKENEMADDFINADGVTIQDMILLFCLYLKADDLRIKKITKSTLLFIDVFARYFCDRKPEKIKEVLCDEKSTKQVIATCTSILQIYGDRWLKKNPVAGMTKYVVDEEIYQDAVSITEQALAFQKSGLLL